MPEALEVSSQKAAYLGTAQGGQAPLATSDSADSVRGTYVKIEFLGGVTMWKFNKLWEARPDCPAEVFEIWQILNY